MKQAAAAYAIAILVVGLIVTAVMARETPTEKKEKQEKKAAAPQTYPSGMTPPREIATRVQAIRGKRFSGAAPGVEILKEEELAKRLTEADTAAEKEAAKEPDVAGLKQATDFVLTQTAAVRPPDLRRVTRQYGGVGTLGAYLPAERKIVLSEELTRSDRRFAEQVIAHEMARALEAPRATPRSALPFRDDDNASVALDEGAATVVEARYATKHLGVKPPVEPTVADRRADELEGRKAPAVQTYTQFPAAVGGPVVAALVREGGWKAVDEAKLQEPLSTRDILHPDTSETADDVPVPRPQITKALGKGWKKMADGEVGELDVLAHLASGGAERRAVQGAEGWVTGAFEVWT
jgi:hypothetical protein